MTEQEIKHLSRLIDRFYEFHKNKKLKNKEVLRFLDVAEYLFKMNVPYRIISKEDGESYSVTFDSPFEEDHKDAEKYSVYSPCLREKYGVIQIKHSIGYGQNNSYLEVTIHGQQIHVFCGNRTRKNLLSNVKRMFANLSDQTKCEMFFNGIKIHYDTND